MMLQQCVRAARAAIVLSASLAILAPTADAQGDSAVAAARAFAETHGARIVREYVEFLRIPNVSSDLANIEKNADYLATALRAREVKVELLRIEGVAPLVVGRLEAPGATRTIGIYMHYDGQPVDARQWTDPPFEPTLRSASIEAGGRTIDLPSTDDAIDPEWRIYARGSGDDKVAAPAILTALDALRDAELQPTVNVIFLFEGEEEVGSPHLAEYLSAHRDRLHADLWLISDGPVHQSRRPQLVFGVRGITGFDLTVYGAARYLHSGHYGNWAPNPGMLLSRLLASMKDAHGDVVIDGFYDSVAALSEAAQAALVAIPDVDSVLRRELGLAAGATEGAAGDGGASGAGSLAARLLRPSLNVRGLASGTVGAQARNVIPTEAEASVDVRLVRGNDPESMLDLVEAHIRAEGFHIVREAPDDATRRTHPRIARVVRRLGYRAAGIDIDDPRAQPVIRAARRAAGDDLVLAPTLGGSLPLYLFEDILAAPVVIVPIANHDDNQHAPDENIRLGNLFYGIELMAALLTMD